MPVELYKDPQGLNPPRRLSVPVSKFLSLTKRFLGHTLRLVNGMTLLLPFGTFPLVLLSVAQPLFRLSSDSLARRTVQCPPGSTGRSNKEWKREARKSGR